MGRVKKKVRRQQREGPRPEEEAVEDIHGSLGDAEADGGDDDGHLVYLALYGVTGAEPERDKDEAEADDEEVVIGKAADEVVDDGHVAAQSVEPQKYGAVRLNEGVEQLGPLLRDLDGLGEPLDEGVVRHLKTGVAHRPGQE